MAQSPVQAQPNTDASSSSGTALGMNIGKVIAGSSSPKQVKNEPFSTTSPEQSKIPEEISEKAGTCNEKSLAIPTSGKGGVGTNCSDGQSLKTACVGGATNTPILRQNSSSSVNSCLGTSPNTSELSNSSNLSSVATAALNQIVDSDVQKEDHAKKKMTGNEENMEKTSCKAKNLGSGIGLASGLSITGTIKEEPADILNSLVNIKKEERENLSPSISPVGFGSIGLDNSNTSGDNIKNRRPSSHAPRSPGTIEANVDSRFASSSPGLIFNHHSNINNNPSLNAYKMSNSNLQVERQSSGLVGSVQFNRRSDNIPLNPNGNRSTTNKIVQNFDPISSLAQMSQQLTSCVSGVGSPVGTGGISMISGSGSGDLNMEHGMISSLDAAAIDVINQNSCHSINPMMNSLGQRMLNPKMCAPGVPGSSFNANSPNSVIRDFGSGPISGSAISPNFQNVLPPGARLMGRMPVNFGSNFNPNIQVKASTPNTIQYMPVRPQNNSNNNNGVSNVRMPPSLEFLQRYANPQMTSVGNGPPTVDGGMLVGTGTGAMIVSSPGDQPNKISNQGTGNTVNFYQNCNQLALMEEDGSLTGHDVGMGIGQPSIIRGMRPHSLRPHATGPRIQNSVNRQIQFSHNADTSECDGSALFNGPACSNTGSNMFSAPQQSNQPKPHHIKTVTSGICQNQTNVGGQIPPHGQGQLQNLIGPSNNNLMATTGNSAPQNGSNLNFVGPSPSDIKYAQQYHSFQQQLYATNTRSQQQQIQQQGNIMAMSPNLSPNPAFFVNK
ncbi:protein BCL9 homolog isoform X5 [Drosophila bipectinata]|uniref:protein BCL9 homolog isoform X5 n=1 Tax=Drosophila bipectinata TaxID=42026 RepID=UPI001C8A0B65|nr:protein BCL9 homolog isoform X4 [Drosophila bipectinata]